MKKAKNARSARFLKNKLPKAKEDAKNGFPVLVNVRIGKTDFRKGSISV